MLVTAKLRALKARLDEARFVAIASDFVDERSAYRLFLLARLSSGGALESRFRLALAKHIVG